MLAVHNPHTDRNIRDDSVSTACVFPVAVSVSFIQLNARSQSAVNTTRVFIAQHMAFNPSGNGPLSTNSRKAWTVLSCGWRKRWHNWRMSSSANVMFALMFVFHSSGFKWLRNSIKTTYFRSWLTTVVDVTVDLIENIRFCRLAASSDRTDLAVSQHHTSDFCVNQHLRIFKLWRLPSLRVYKGLNDHHPQHGKLSPACTASCVQQEESCLFVAVPGTLVRTLSMRHI